MNITRIHQGIVAVAAASVMTLSAAPAIGATTASAGMVIDWSSLTQTSISSGSDPAPILSWSNPFSTVNAYAPEAISIGDWTTPLAAQTGNAASFSTANADASMLHSHSEDSDARADSSGSIWALREGELSVTGNGSVQFSVNYTWNATLLPPADSVLSFAYSFASLGAETRNDPRVGNRSGYDQIDIQLFSTFPDDIGSFQGSGTLAFEMAVVDGDHFYFTAQSSTTANISAVPLPASGWLVLAGLPILFCATRMRDRGSIADARTAVTHA